MSINRVQKLLFSEYCDFEDMVLIESPFAQTTREGRGIRQVYLGLTPTKLILASDVITSVEHSCYIFKAEVDPDIETFELIAIYPVECVNLSIFSRQKRQALKAHFCNNCVLYFELGGFERRDMFWNLWKEKINFLCPEEQGSSKSQTSVESASTSSTLYLIDRKEISNTNGMRQLWCKFGTGKSQSSLLQKWTDRYLYMGSHFEGTAVNYVPRMIPPTVSQFVGNPEWTRNKYSLPPSVSSSLINTVIRQDSVHINRFGEGVQEKCSCALLLFPEEDISRKKIIQPLSTSGNPFMVPVDYSDMINASLKLWEKNQYRCDLSHKRRFGFCPQPFFLYGLGPWGVSTSATFSLQVKKAVSAVIIKRQPIDNGLRLPVSKRQLTTTISYGSFNTYSLRGRKNRKKASVIFFWTPCYWYRPRTAKDAYDELRKHLTKLKDWREKQNNKKKIFRKYKFKSKPKSLSNTTSDLETDSMKSCITKPKHSKRLFKLFRRNIDYPCDNVGRCKTSKETTLHRLKKSLRMNVVLTAWDFDSITLAQQLTMIDKELFIKITELELGVILWEHSSKNAPNVAAVIAFSHRMSCLIAHEILRENSEKIRARLIARFINVAEKCYQMSNFQSCRSVLCGLQCPAIFRLKLTWAYVRKKHATTYQIFERLCRTHRDVRLPSYQKTVIIAIQDPPFLPYIGDILTKLLGRIPKYKLQSFKDKSNTTISIRNNRSGMDKSTSLIDLSKPTTNVVTKFFTALKEWVTPNGGIQINNDETYCKPKFRLLYDYDEPLILSKDEKKKFLLETKDFVQTCQLAALNYTFTKNDLAREYLLKARYREEKENFYKSLNMELPNYCNKDLLCNKNSIK